MRNSGKRWRRLAAAAIIAGSAAPTVLRWLRRAGAARRAVDMRMTVVVERPVGEVFEFCRDFENFPTILDVPLNIQDFQDGRSRWSVQSPGGHAIEWDATVTKYVPNSVIAWESVATAPVRSSGTMRFAPLGPNATRVDLSLTYLPHHTDLGDALHALMIARANRRVRDQVAHASVALSRGAEQAAPQAELR